MSFVLMSLVSPCTSRTYAPDILKSSINRLPRYLARLSINSSSTLSFCQVNVIVNGPSGRLMQFQLKTGPVTDPHLLDSQSVAIRSMERRRVGSFIARIYAFPYCLIAHLGILQLALSRSRRDKKTSVRRNTYCETNIFSSLR